MPFRGSRVGGQRAWLFLALSIYALILAASPILHHDLACHVKAPTHCDACVASPAASRAETRIALVVPPLSQAGEFAGVNLPAPVGPRLPSTPGRAPPA